MSNFIFVVTIALETPIYLTDFHRDIQYKGHNHIAGKLVVDQAVTQKSEPSANDFKLKLSAVDQILVSAIAGSNYKGRQCIIERLTLNDDETIADSEVWLDGDLNKYTFKNGLKDSTLTLTVSSIFGAFESVQIPNLAVKFADTINSEDTLYWGKKSAASGLQGTRKSHIPDYKLSDEKGEER